MSAPPPARWTPRYSGANPTASSTRSRQDGPQAARGGLRRRCREGFHIEDVKNVACVPHEAGPTPGLQRVKNVMIPNMYYREDIGDRWFEEDSDRLHAWGVPPGGVSDTRHAGSPRGRSASSGVKPGAGESPGRQERRRVSATVARKTGSTARSLGRPAFSLSTMSVGRSTTRTTSPSSSSNSGACSRRSS